MAPVARRSVRNKMALSVGLIKYRYVDVRPHRYQHYTLTLFVGPAVRVSGCNPPPPPHFPQKDWHRQVWFLHFGSETACDKRKASYLLKKKNQNSTHVRRKWYQVGSRLKQNMPQVKLPSEVWFTHQSRHAKQVRFAFQHVTKHRPLVLRNGCEIS